VRDSAAVGNATVTRDISTAGVRGLIVKLNGKSYASYRNDNGSSTSVDLTNAVVNGNTNQIHFSRADSLINKPVILSSTTYSIPANEQIFLVSTNTPVADTGRGWQNYPELLAKTDSFTTAQNGTWNSNATWSANDVPQSNNNALINHDVVLGTSATVNNLTIAAGKTVSIANNQTLTVTGGLVNNGTINGGGNLILTATPVSGNGTINNVTINSNSGVVLNGAQTITGVLTPTTGTVFTNNNLTLASTGLATASIAAGSGNYINGNVTVQRFINAKRAFRFLGHPFNSGIALTQLTTAMDITGGAGNPSLGFTPTITNNPSAYWFNTGGGNNGTFDAGWNAFTDLTQTTGNNGWNRYKGINLLIRGNKGDGVNGNPYTPANVTLAINGAVNTGTQTIALNNAATGWNLIANPYPSSVNLQTPLTNAGITNGVYIWNAQMPGNGGYQAIPVSSNYVLPSGAAFMIKSTTAGQNIVFNESDKTTAAAVTVFGVKNGLQIDLLKDTLLYDRLYVLHNTNASAAKDIYDLEKLINANGSIYALSKDSMPLSIDALPVNQFTQVPLALSLKDTGNYTISFAAIQLTNSIPLYLHDKLLNVYEEIVAGKNYSFRATANDSTQLLNRFELTAFKKEILAGNASAFDINIASTANQWAVNYNNNSNEEAIISIYDLNGNSIKNYNIGNTANGTLYITKTSLANAVYVLEMKSINNRVVKK